MWFIMPDGFIGIDTNEVLRSSKVVEKQLAKVPGAVYDAVIDSVSTYLLDVFRAYPPPNHTIKRRQAYPDSPSFQTPSGKWIRIPGYFSWKQFIKVIMINKEGGIPYRRTNQMRKAWKQVDRGRDSIIVNETEAAVYTMGDNTRARFSKLVGWKTMEEIVTSRMKQIERIALAGANKGIKKVLPK